MEDPEDQDDRDTLYLLKKELDNKKEDLYHKVNSNYIALQGKNKPALSPDFAVAALERKAILNAMSRALNARSNNKYGATNYQLDRQKNDSRYDSRRWSVNKSRERSRSPSKSPKRRRESLIKK